MGEKRVIKLRTDMYEDTKFKIIDTMAERDTINYIWTRILTLCGKVNDSEGRLYVTKNMPYTIEILALEFNRPKEQVENAMRVFDDLNMVCRGEDGVFKVCNWNKYQGGRKNVCDKNIEQESVRKKERNIEQNKNGVISNKCRQNDDKSSKDTKDNENETNIIDITKGDLVKDKNTGSKNLNKESKVKTRRKAKKKAVKSNDIITCDEDFDSEEIMYFTEGEPVYADSERVAFYNFE